MVTCKQTWCAREVTWEQAAGRESNKGPGLRFWKVKACPPSDSLPPIRLYLLNKATPSKRATHYGTMWAVFIHTSIATWSWAWGLFCIHLTFLRYNHSLNLESLNLARVAGQRVPFTQIHSLSAGAADTCMLQYWVCVWLLRIQTQFFILME